MALVEDLVVAQADRPIDWSSGTRVAAIDRSCESCERPAVDSVRAACPSGNPLCACTYWLWLCEEHHADWMTDPD
jgi:hypothetical protein